jgi:type IX secretion system substrate protein/beta-propeller repeat-containing protein
LQIQAFFYGLFTVCSGIANAKLFIYIYLQISIKLKEMKMIKTNSNSTLFCLFLSVFLSLHGDIFSQPLWVSRYSDPAGAQQIASGLAVDNLGNAYVIGTTKITATNADVVTLKYNPATGDTLWVKKFGGSPNLNDFPTAITTDNAGFVYVTGWYFNPGRDMFVIKYNASTGDSVWTRSYNGPATGGDYSFSVAVDVGGNVYITGRSDSAGAQRFTTIKYNSSGVRQWVVRFNPPPPVTGVFDEARMVKVDAAGNVYVTGSSEANISSTSDDYLTVKYDMNGMMLWQKRHPGTGIGTATDDYAIGLVLDGTPNVYVTGYCNNYQANYDYFTIKYNGATGDSLASHTYNGTGGGPDVTTAITIDNSSNIYVTGYSEGAGNDFATIKYNSNLVPAWIKRYNGSGNDLAYGVAVNSFSEVYVTGNSFTATGYDFLTIKYSSIGDSIAAQLYNASANIDDYVAGIGLDVSSNVFISGSGAFSLSDTTDIVTIKYPSGLINGIKPISNEVPSKFSLTQNYPNPFNPVTSFRFDVPLAANVNITIYDITGKEISVLFNGNLKPGKYQATWNADGFASGVYFYKLTSAAFSQTKKMVLSK